jgi:hypothetical protein
MTFSIMTLSVMTLSLLTLSMKLMGLRYKGRLLTLLGNIRQDRNGQWTGSGKHSSLLRYGYNSVLKRFYSTGRGIRTHDLKSFFCEQSMVTLGYTV